MTERTAPPSSSIGNLVKNAPEGVSTLFDLRDRLVTDEDGEARDVPALIIERRNVLPEVREPTFGMTPPAAHDFYAVDGFVAYLDKFGSDETVVLINPAGRCVEAILAEARLPQEDPDAYPGNAGGRAVIRLVPQVHPRWAPWQALLDAVLPIERFVHFLRCNRRSIVEPDGRDLTLTLAQVRMSTEICLHRGSGKSAVNGLVVRTKISGREDSELVDLPEQLVVRAPLWVDRPEQDVELDLILNGSADGTNVTAQIASADIQEAESRAFDDVAAELRDRLTDDRYTVAFGSVDEGDWVMGEA